MQKLVGIIFLFIILCCGMFLPLFPFFNQTSNLSNSDFHNIISCCEIENTPQTSSPNNKSFVLEWDVVNAMFQKFQNTTIFDLLTKTQFSVQRTGGVFHADIEPSNQESVLSLNSILPSSSSSPRPALICLNNLWVCCSLDCNFHGFNLITSTSNSGHLCLHFLNSKTDTTHQKDPIHQKTIFQAQKLSKNIFPNQYKN